MADPSPPEQLVAGKYRVTRLLGQGGMGSVWEGLHVTLGTRVAIKFIESEYADNDEAQQRFVNEARAAARLRTKHVVGVLDQGVTEGGNPYIVMEYLAGEPLDKRLARLGQLSLQDTARILVQVCRALARAHEAGIVHRDLKPENIFLVHDEEDGSEIAKVVDFGIAKFTDKSMGVSSSTRTGSVLGTPYYMSPEQARGLRNIDVRSDLWSVGVIAYRCVVGRLPFEGEAVGDLLVKICTSPLPVPSATRPELPPEFDAWFARALEREPADRFQSAQALSEQLSVAAGLSSGPPLSLPLSSLAPTLTPAGHPTPASGAVPVAQTVGAFTQNNRASKKALPLLAVAGGGLVVFSLLGLGVALALRGGAASAGAAQPDPAAPSAVADEPTPTAEPSEPPGVEPADAPAPASAEPPLAQAAADPPPAKAAGGPAPAKPKPTAKPVATTAQPAPKPTVKPGVDLGY